MEKITKPRVRTLATGNELITKQMQANAGDVLPKHSSNLESVLFIHRGECILRINGEEILMKENDSYIIPPETPHQIKVTEDFKGVHFMPKAIKFEYFD